MLCCCSSCLSWCWLDTRFSHLALYYRVFRFLPLAWIFITIGFSASRTYSFRSWPLPRRSFGTFPPPPSSQYADPPPFPPPFFSEGQVLRQVGTTRWVGEANLGISRVEWDGAWEDSGRREPERKREERAASSAGNRRSKVPHLAVG